MLGRPAAAGLGAVVVGPDELVEERLAPEDLVEQQLAVVRLAVVDVEVERPVGGEQLTAAGQARREEAKVVTERVGVGQAREQLGAVAPPAEADPALRSAVFIQQGRGGPIVAAARVT